MQLPPSVPGYELIERLGGGPLTCVYSARDSATGELCAVKLLRPDWEDQPTAVKLLQREARTGLAIRHPHLVPFLFAHVTRPPYFLVMELLKGESLRRRLRRDDRLDVLSALWIVRQCAEALTALHRAGFLHGDIKPDNIRLVEDGHAVLIDLGFAHRPGENAHLLKRGYVLGTVDYLAPELCAFDEETETCSDIFSLGVTLFEMLTGQLPYPHGTIEQTLRRHSAEPPADIRDLAEGLPSGLVTLIDRLLSRQPQDRPRAGQVVQHIIALESSLIGRRMSA
ncbi:MAG TPA: serine/threonine-protein kinase [Gemmataceae bacterium]|nr:serine/threonine-protein kinase [Gemmataceae bacterium]